jgi:uncharacterized protein
MTAVVRDNASRQRYELLVDAGLVAHLAYRRIGGAVALLRTDVDPACDRLAHATELVEGALRDLHAHGRFVIPVCPFVARYLAGTA